MELEGIAVQIGKRSFTVPPMSVAAFERVAAPAERDTFEEALERVRVLLEDNYPDLTVGELKKLVRVRDLATVSMAVATAAGAGLEASGGKRAARRD